MLFGSQHIGKAIVILREAKGYNQIKLATAIGIDNTQLSRYETGSGRVSEEVLGKIAQVLGHEVIEILDTAYAIFRFNHLRIEAQRSGTDMEELLARYDPRSSVEEVLAAHASYVDKRQEFDRQWIELLGREKRQGFTVLRHIVETERVTRKKKTKKPSPKKDAGR
jgi:transcriptional regulator with XRE-family HTH domain